MMERLANERERSLRTLALIYFPVLLNDSNWCRSLFTRLPQPPIQLPPLPSERSKWWSTALHFSLEHIPVAAMVYDTTGWFGITPYHPIRPIAPSTSSASSTPSNRPSTVDHIYPIAPLP
jgi:hypothetical protein